MSTTIAQRLYELRRAHGISQEDLARKLGVSRQAVSKWECGESVPGTDNLIALARLYGVELDALLGIGRDAEAGGEAPTPAASSSDDVAKVQDEADESAEPPASPNRRRALIAIACGALAVLLTLILLYCVRANTPDYIVIEGTVMASDGVFGDFVVDMGYTEQSPSRYIVCGADSTTTYDYNAPDEPVDAGGADESVPASREPIELQEGWRVSVSFDVRGGVEWPQARNLADSVQIETELA